MKTRKCKQWGCKTILNAYNRAKYCAIHKAKRLMEKLKKEDEREFAKHSKKYKRITKWVDSFHLKDIIHLGDNFKRHQLRTRKHLGKCEFALYVKD